MNDKHIKGAIDEAKGQVKENIGHAFGKNKMEGEGIADRLKGKVEKGLGDIKDKVKEEVDTRFKKNERKSA